MTVLLAVNARIWDYMPVEAACFGAMSSLGTLETVSIVAERNYRSGSAGCTSTGLPLLAQVNETKCSQ